MIANRDRFIPEKDYWDYILCSMLRQEEERAGWKQRSFLGDDKPLDYASLEKIIEDLKTTMEFTEADMEILEAGQPRYICMIRYSLYENLPAEGLVERVGEARFKLTQKGFARAKKSDRGKKPK